MEHEAVFLDSVKNWVEEKGLLVNNPLSQESLRQPSDDPSKKRSHGGTLLHKAAERGYTSAIGYLLDQGAEIDLTDSEGNTPLHWASKNYHKPAIELLISRGAKKNVWNNNRETPDLLFQRVHQTLTPERISFIDQVNKSQSS
jgi:ankyrin repeat protein